VWIRGGDRSVIARVSEVPIAFGGTARYNIANALAAIGAASGLGLTPEAMRLGLTRFGTSHAENPGRANRWDLGGIAVIVDYAHNPHGLAAISEVTGGIPARRRGLVIGQAGDRDDAAIREFARTAWSTTPDRVFIKEMESYLRGRDRGVVPALIEAELRSAGAAPESLERHPSEMDAVRAALAWARAGDVLLLTTHADRDAVIALLERLAERGWKPGEDVPT
jgi:cyanophycin synthetase